MIEIAIVQRPLVRVLGQGVVCGPDGLPSGRRRLRIPAAVDALLSGRPGRASARRRSSGEDTT